MDVSNLTISRDKLIMLKEETMSSQPKAWTQCSVTNSLINQTFSTQLLLEELLLLKWLAVLWDQPPDQWPQWKLLMLVQQLLLTLTQLNTGLPLIRMWLKPLLKKVESYQEDQPGPSTDKLIPHQEDFTWLNSMTHTVRLVITQETSYQLVPPINITRIMSSRSEPHRLPIIFQATMVSYPTLM